MFSERNEKNLRQVLNGSIIGYKWFENHDNFLLLNDKPTFDSNERKPMLFVFEDGSIPKKTIEEIYHDENTEITIMDDDVSYLGGTFHTIDKNNGISSSWKMVSSYEPESKQRKNLYDIFWDIRKKVRNRPREMVPKRIKEMENYMRKIYGRGFFDSSTYNSLKSRTNPSNSFRTSILVARGDGVYDATALGNELNDLENSLGGEADEKVQFEFKDDRMKFGRLTYKQKIGEAEGVQIFRLTDKEFKEEAKYDSEYSRMPNFNSDGTRLSGTYKSDIVHETTITLYPDKFLAADARRSGSMNTHGCDKKTLEAYKEEKKCWNWWDRHNR